MIHFNVCSPSQVFTDRNTGLNPVQYFITGSRSISQVDLHNSSPSPCSISGHRVQLLRSVFCVLRSPSFPLDPSPSRSISITPLRLNMSQDGGQCGIDVSILEALWFTAVAGQTFFLKVPTVFWKPTCVKAAVVFRLRSSCGPFARRGATLSHWLKRHSRWSEIDPLCSIPIDRPSWPRGSGRHGNRRSAARADPARSAARGTLNFECLGSVGVFVGNVCQSALVRWLVH